MCIAVAVVVHSRSCGGGAWLFCSGGVWPFLWWWCVALDPGRIGAVVSKGSQSWVGVTVLWWSSCGETEVHQNMILF
eukprot:3104009-Ditylum_brightwellii.AAC.1